MRNIAFLRSPVFNSHAKDLTFKSGDLCIPYNHHSCFFHDSLMFWTDWGFFNGKIEKASLNGGQRVAIITNLLYPNGIELDRGNKRIFWVDAGYNTVESVDYNGNSWKVLYQLSGSYPFGLALIPPFLFFTYRLTAEDIHQLDATTGKVIRKYSVNGGLPTGIVAYDASRQPAGI